MTRSSSVRVPVGILARCHIFTYAIWGCFLFLQSALTDVTLEDPPQGCVESSHMQGLVHLLKKILKIERTAQEQMTAQIYFILGLVVKAIRVALTVSVFLCGWEDVCVCVVYVGWVCQNDFHHVCLNVCVLVSIYSVCMRAMYSVTGITYRNA